MAIIKKYADDMVYCIKRNLSTQLQEEFSDYLSYCNYENDAHDEFLEKLTEDEALYEEYYLYVKKMIFGGQVNG